MEYVMFLVAGTFIALATLERNMERDMERKVGEVFKLRCKKYKTVENKDGFRCFNCDLYELLDCFSPGIRTRGYCTKERRTDDKDVYFIEVEE